MIRVAIAGGAGYTAGELIRLLINRKDVEITYILSMSNAGNAISDVHADLLGEINMVFASSIDFNNVDIIFLCMGHGKSKEFLNETYIPDNVKIIDLSTDFRLKTGNNNFIYGLPELNKKEIKNSNYIANPGCFATAIQLSILPLADKGILNELHINAITGSTGAGQKPIATTHFSWRNNNVSVYKAFNHQHLNEIKQSIMQLQPNFNHDINFIPTRGDFSRGIMAVTYTKCDLSLDEAKELYNRYYKSHPFVIISDKNPNLKQVVNTNKAIIYLEKHNDKLLIISLIDNLLKGASGQAVQNMNLIFNLNEDEGLKLKAVAF